MHRSHLENLATCGVVWGGIPVAEIRVTSGMAGKQRAVGFGAAAAETKDLAPVRSARFAEGCFARSGHQGQDLR
jgi:hypothetical protein